MLNIKNMPKSRRHLLLRVYTMEKYLCKKLGVKERGGCLLKGVYFRKCTVRV